MEGLTRKDKMHKCLIGSHHIGEADECEIHRTITLVLHQSDAGDYIDGILKHLDQINVRGDGSTEVGYLIELRLGGWLRSIRAC